jgi:hypothetical protein
MLTQDLHDNRGVYPHIVVDDHITELAHADHGISPSCVQESGLAQDVKRLGIEFFRMFRGYQDLPASPPHTEGEGAGGGAYAMHDVSG